MKTIIKATFIQGVFRPQEPIALAEGAQVELTLTMPSETAQLPVGPDPDGISKQPAEELRGARLIREAAESHAALIASSERLLKSLGIHGEPIGAKALQERMIAEGVNPDGNEFSREIIAMREE